MLQRIMWKGYEVINQLRQNVTKLIIYTPIRCYTVIAKVYIFQEKMYSCDFKNHFQYDQLPMKALIPNASANGL